MSDAREALVALIRREYDKHPVDRYPTEGALADAILAEFDVTPKFTSESTLGQIADALRPMREAGMTRSAVEFVVDQVWFDVTERGEGQASAKLGQDLAEDLRRAADRCCQCDDEHCYQPPVYGTVDYVGMGRDLARKIASLLDGAPTTLPSVEAGEVAQDPREVAHIECDCVPDLGPSHCHLCGTRAGTPVPWSKVHPPTTLPSEEDVARALRERHAKDGSAIGSWEDVPEGVRVGYRANARAVLALLPGRTEAEVKAEALAEALVPDYTDIANRAQEALGRGVHPSTVKAVLDAVLARGEGS